MKKEIVRNAIKENNPWWEDNYKFDRVAEREIYPKIKKTINSKQILSLTGLRRVGKTTLMKKLIQDLLDKGVRGENIFYFSFDEFFDQRIREVLNIYEDLQKKSLGKDKLYVFLDEIQKVENWQDQIKRVYDNFSKVKFIISGSESLFIKNKSKESLAGRIFEFNVELLSFKEYLDFKKVDYGKLELNKERIKKEFQNYLKSGGFPEISLEKNMGSNLYIKSVIDKVIDSDMPRVFGIKNPAEVRDVFNRIYDDPGQIIEIQELGKELGMDRNKVSYILECLENSFLIRRLYNFSRNARKVQRKLKKYYPHLINPYIIESNFGGVFETFLVINSDAQYFWRDPFKNEVDIVLYEQREKSKKVLGLEIKSGEVKKDTLKSLEKFISNFGLEKEKAKIISFDYKDEKRGFKIVPFYEHLLK